VELGQSSFFNVLTDERTGQTLKLMGKSPGERITSEIGREICQRRGVKVLLASSIATLERPIRHHAGCSERQQRRHTGEVQAQADSKEHVLKAIDQAAGQLRSKLGESLASIRKFDKPLQEATT